MDPAKKIKNIKHMHLKCCIENLGLGIPTWDLPICQSCKIKINQKNVKLTAAVLRSPTVQWETHVSYNTEGLLLPFLIL